MAIFIGCLYVEFEVDKKVSRGLVTGYNPVGSRDGRCYQE